MPARCFLPTRDRVEREEEVTLLFGTNRTWHTAGKQHTIDLSDRIILNPLVAKRLNKLLSSVLAEYEQKFGELTL